MVNFSYSKYKIIYWFTFFMIFHLYNFKLKVGIWWTENLRKINKFSNILNSSFKWIFFEKTVESGKINFNIKHSTKLTFNYQTKIQSNILSTFLALRIDI